MRIFLACLLLLVAPVLLVVVVKGYQQYQAQQFEQQKASSAPQAPGEVLFFNASWCGPCRQMKPIVTQLRRQGYHLRDVDVDQNKSLAHKYAIHGIPTFVFVKNGTEVHRFSGGTSAENLRKLCSSPAYH